jgi:hypothetical protein
MKMLSHFQTTITGILLIASRYSSPVDAFVQNPTSIAANECRGMKMPFFDPNTPKLGASPQVDQEEEIQSLVPPTKFVPLFDQAYQATLPKEADNTKNAHDPFRFEWGTWVDNEAILELMARVDEVRASPGAFDTLQAQDSSMNGEQKNKGPTSIKIASGPKWDCILHALPSNTQYQYRWPTGSWSILKALTGVVEVAMLKEDRDGNTTKRTTKDLRGGSDGNFGVGGGASIGGADCIKYGKNITYLTYTRFTEFNC